MNKKIRHYEESTLINTPPQKLFTYIDDHTRLVSHMSNSSWMMGGGHMDTQVDSERGQKVGSHIRMRSRVFGLNLFLDEVVTQYEPPHLKIWQTVGDLNLLVIGHYQMGFEILGENGKSKFTVFIRYKLPESMGTRWLGYIFGGFYAKWCVRQMLYGPKKLYS